MVAVAARRPNSNSWLRLRQICLVAEDLERQAALIGRIFGLEICYRDPNVAKYGLANVLFPIGTDFLEIVSPLQSGTAAGRFLERHRGRHGYMIIMDCADPAARQTHCASIGVRTANLIRHGSYLGAQMHPKDTGGAMLEFNRTEGGTDPLGPYSPAGDDWQKFVRLEVTQRLLAAEIECDDPAGFSRRWAEILQKPASINEDAHEIALDPGTLRFLPSTDAQAALSGIEVQVSDAAAVTAAARELGCVDGSGRVDVCGIRVHLREGPKP